MPPLRGQRGLTARSCTKGWLSDSGILISLSWQGWSLQWKLVSHLVRVDKKANLVDMERKVHENMKWFGERRQSCDHRLWWTLGCYVEKIWWSTKYLLCTLYSIDWLLQFLFLFATTEIWNVKCLPLTGITSPLFVHYSVWTLLTSAIPQYSLWSRDLRNSPYHPSLFS